MGKAWGKAASNSVRSYAHGAMLRSDVRVSRRSPRDIWSSSTLGLQPAVLGRFTMSVTRMYLLAAGAWARAARTCFASDLDGDTETVCDRVPIWSAPVDRCAVPEAAVERVHALRASPAIARCRKKFLPEPLSTEYCISEPRKQE